MNKSRLLVGTLLMVSMACERGRRPDPNDNTPPVFKDSGTDMTVLDSGTNVDPDGGVNPTDTGTNNSDTGVNDTGSPVDTGEPPTGRSVGAACANAAECASNSCLSGAQPW